MKGGVDAPRVTFALAGPTRSLYHQNLCVTLHDIIDRLDEFADEETIYAESMRPMARAVVAAEPEDGSVPPIGAGLSYLLEVGAAREAIEAWGTSRPGQNANAGRQARSRDVLRAERRVAADRVVVVG
jgi:hypothetical protein